MQAIREGINFPDSASTQLLPANPLRDNPDALRIPGQYTREGSTRPWLLLSLPSKPKLCICHAGFPKVGHWQMRLTL